MAKAIGYTRVSTGSQAESGLGLAAQRSAVEGAAKRLGLELVAVHADEGLSGSLGLEELGVIGEHFNPAVHEALGQDAADTLETDDTITVVLEKGWKIGDTVVRPAKVRVAHYQK